MTVRLLPILVLAILTSPGGAEAAKRDAVFTWSLAGVMSYTARAQVEQKDCGKSIAGRVLHEGQYRAASARVSCTR